MSPIRTDRAVYLNVEVLKEGRRLCEQVEIRNYGLIKHFKTILDSSCHTKAPSLCSFLVGAFKDPEMNTIFEELAHDVHDFWPLIGPGLKNSVQFDINIVGRKLRQKLTKELTVQPLTVERLVAEDGWLPELKEDADPTNPWPIKMPKRPGLQHTPFRGPPGLSLPCADTKEVPSRVPKTLKGIRNRSITEPLGLGFVSVLDQKMGIPSEKTLAELCAEFDGKQERAAIEYVVKIMNVLNLDPPKKPPTQLSLQEEMELASAASFLMRLNSLNLEPTR